MKVFADSSVLIPVFIPSHQHHDRSFNWFSAADPGSAACAAHSLAEVYSTMTRLPIKYRATEQHALLFLEAIEEHFSVITLDVDEYRAAIWNAAALGVAGGTIYDALIAACALKAKADVLYTWNTVHFSSMGEEIARRVRTP